MSIYKLKGGDGVNSNGNNGGDFKIFCAGKSSELNSFHDNTTWRDFKKIHNTFQEDYISDIYCIKESALFITQPTRSVYALSNSKLSKLGIGEEIATIDPIKLNVAHLINDNETRPCGIEKIPFPKIISIAFSDNITAFLSEEGCVIKRALSLVQ